MRYLLLLSIFAVLFVYSTDIIVCKWENKENVLTGKNKTQQNRTFLKIKKEPVYHLFPNESIYFETNNGTEMLLRVINTSTSNRAKFFVNCDNQSLLKYLPPNSPDSSLILIKDWSGSQLLITNVTDSLNSATLSVLLVGN